MPLNICPVSRLATVAGVVALLFSGLAHADNAKPSFLDGSTLKVCTSGGFPPMEYYAKPGDTEMIGFEVDVIKALAEHWGAKVEMVVGDFKALLPSLDTRRCGIVASGISITPERLMKYDGVPYFRTWVVMVTSAKDSTIKVPEDLSGKTVAVEAGTTYEGIVAKLNEGLKSAGRAPVQMQTYAATSDVIQQVLVGRAAASIAQDTEAAYRSKQVPGRLQMPYKYKDSEMYGMYIRKNPKDLAILQSSFDALQASGKLKPLLAKWSLPAEATDGAHTTKP